MYECYENQWGLLEEANFSLLYSVHSAYITISICPESISKAALVMNHSLDYIVSLRSNEVEVTGS